VRSVIYIIALALAVLPARALDKPIPAPSAVSAEDGQWTTPAKNYASTRYSGLEEINTSNVGKLQVAFSFATGVNRGQYGAPLVVCSTIYLVTPYPNFLYALYLTRPGAPIKWQYNP